MSDKNKIHDNCKHVISFCNNLERFLKTLNKTFPEHSRNIKKSWKYFKQTPREKYIIMTVKSMENHIKHISEYDEGIFSEDYKKGKLCLLVGLDFKLIWKVLESDNFGGEDARETTKKHIFNHLQAIYVIAELACNQVSEFNNSMKKQKQFLIDMLKNINMDEALKERIEKLANEENEGNGGGLNMEGMEKLSEIFGGDGFISKLAKDITEELNLGGDGCDNPVEAITELFANDGEKLQELIVKIGDKIEEKISKGEITQEQLTQEAEQMKEKMSGVMGPLDGLSTDPKEYYHKEYSNLSDEEQAKYSGLEEIIDRDQETWSDQDKELYNNFYQQTMSKNTSQMFKNMTNMMAQTAQNGQPEEISSNHDKTEPETDE